MDFGSMDFGSLDFGTWRLVGLGLLALGALATVIAIVAIVIMFRGGSTDDDHARADEWQDDADTEWHDDADTEWHDDQDDEDEDPRPRAGGPDKLAAAATTRAPDGGPMSVPVGFSSPKEGLFTVSANASPQQSTRDEPRVPSSDWYEHPDVIAAFGAIREADPPSTPPPSPPPRTAPEQSVARPESRRHASRWFDDSTGSDEASRTVPVRQFDAQSPPAAVSPVNFPWEQPETATAPPETATAPPETALPETATPETATAPPETATPETATAPPETAPPERPVAPAHRQPERPDDQDDRRPDTGTVANARPTAPNPPERREPWQPTAERHAERVDTGSLQAAASPVSPNPPERQDPDSPTADWYDDPDGSGGERWWDGKGWTRHRRSRSASPATSDTGRVRAVTRPRADPPAAARGQTAPTAGPADAQGGQPSSRPPGWYRDPTGSGSRRFWDGSRWTNDT